MKGSRSAIGESAEQLTRLLARVALKDGLAFAELHAMTQNKLRKTALAVGVSPGDVDDTLQDAYLKIWRNAASFDVNRASGITWLCTIVRNTAIDALRAQKPPTSELDEAITIPAETPGSDEFDYTNAEPVAARALERLPEDSRASLAQRFGVPVGTIKTWLRRTIAALRHDCLTAAG
jgi:RNA polymerase sigma-70 factor (ECF subfamily)